MYKAIGITAVGKEYIAYGSDRAEVLEKLDAHGLDYAYISIEPIALRDLRQGREKLHEYMD